MLKRSAVAVSLAIVIMAPGCEQGPADDRAAEADPTFTARDSAGIEIVENHAPEHAPDEFWTIDPEPEFVLGGANTLGEPAHDSAQLIWRVKGLARLKDGRVAVLSSGNKHLMLFEPSGELSMIMGGPGEGPGEFVHPLAFQYLPPDTLVVWDFFLTSIDYFDTGGNLLKERTLDHGRLREHGVGPESLRLPLADGSFLAWVEDWTADESPDDCSHLSEVGRVSSPAGGRLSEEEMTFPGVELLRTDDVYAAYSFGCARPWRTHLAAGGDPPLVYISNADGGIHQRSFDGTPVRIIRRTVQPPPVTDRALRAEREHWARIREIEGWPPQTEEDEPIPRREKYPAVEALLVDAEGYLWVREWSTSESGIPDQWSVFGPDGRWLGALAFPPDLLAPDRHLCHLYTTTCWIDRDYFVILREDELGVERVEGYRIRRDRAGGSVPP
ncbi:MAG: hypothetical protein F4087_12845 [Gemmatimonadetes bacterium]|nr:hypothetical protein [Gemmatimonadota bacterium]MYE68709.1 hypothetical protein [Gemmatimonadota bacterium]MYJ69376.1 hypothetical protein [Gemmatimonadota bacterium]